MRTLLLLRHAKSSWDDPSLDDFDRPLAPRGQGAAPRMATYLKKKSLRPDFVLCSSACRAVQTWSLVSDVLGGNPEVKFLRSLYLAPPSRLIDIIRRVPDNAPCAMLIAHNPGMEHLAAVLAGADSKKKALEKLYTKYPTAALAQLEFDTDNWKDIERGAGRLTRLIWPRDLD